MASELPTVGAPTASPLPIESTAGEWNSAASMLTQRLEISWQDGYSSVSTKLMSSESIISWRASSSIYVVTKLARFRTGRESSSRKSLITW